MVPELYERLHCRATNDFAVALIGRGRIESLVTDDYETARREAATHARMLPKRGQHTLPPSSYHGLRVAGTTTWVHSDQSLGQLALARLFRHEALDYEREPCRLIAVVGPRKGAPVLVVAVGEGARGDHHVELLRESGPKLKFRSYPVVDLRGLVEGGWRMGMKRFADPVDHPVLNPVLDVDSAGSEYLAA